MSANIYRDDYYERREREREEYRGDVFYEVWRSGGNPDRIDDDRVNDRFYDGYQADECAHAEQAVIEAEGRERFKKFMGN